MHYSVDMFLSQEKTEVADKEIKKDGAETSNQSKDEPVQPSGGDAGTIERGSSAGEGASKKPGDTSAADDGPSDVSTKAATKNRAK